MNEPNPRFPLDATLSGSQGDRWQTVFNPFNDSNWQRRRQQSLYRLWVHHAFGFVSPETEARIRAASMGDLACWMLPCRIQVLPSVRTVPRQVIG